MLLAAVLFISLIGSSFLRLPGRVRTMMCARSVNVSVIEAHKRQSHKYGNILMPLTIRGNKVTSIHLENNHVPERKKLKKWL